MFFRMINVDGLTSGKMDEINEEFFKKNPYYNIVCITETHQTCNDININDKLMCYTKMREGFENERLGGGLMILMRENPKVDMEEVKVKSEEVMIIEGKCFGLDIKVVLVYFDVRRTPEGRENNSKIREVVEKIIEKNNREGLIILGDFNGHIEDLDGRKTDENGKMVLDWTNRFDLTLMNGDNKCVGTFTRSKLGIDTAIDMVLVNRMLYERCREMRIDEEREVMQISDHNLVTVDLKVRLGRGYDFGKKWEKVEYYRKGVDAMKEFGDEVESEWRERDIKTVEEMTMSVFEVAERVLKREFRRYVSEEKGWVKIAEPWMNEEIRLAIKERKRINRKRRRCRCEKERRRLWDEYMTQKRLVQRLIREAKERHEIRLTKEVLEDRGNGSVWKNINKLLGKRGHRDEEIKIYRDGKLLEIEEALRDFFEFWRLVYNTSVNEIGEIWDEERMEELIRVFEEEEREYNRSQEEHLDTTKSARHKIRPMVIEEMGEKELREVE